MTVIFVFSRKGAALQLTISINVKTLFYKDFLKSPMSPKEIKVSTQEVKVSTLEVKVSKELKDSNELKGFQKS